MSDLSPWKAFIDKASDIITAASHNSLGIVALVILAMFIVGYIWFNPESVRVRIGMFLAMVASALVFFLVGLHGYEIDGGHKKIPIPPPVSDASTGQEVTYVGRVQNDLTMIPVQNAKATIIVEQKSPFDYSDSNGIFRVKVKQTKTDSEARLEVLASGYKVYDQHLDPESATTILPVHLDPMKTPTYGLVAAAGKVSYLGRVLDITTRSPVVGAKVVLGVQPPAYSDNDGAFFFDLPTRPKAPITLRASAQGYENFEQAVEPEESAKPIDIRLKKLPGDTAQH